MRVREVDPPPHGATTLLRIVTNGLTLFFFDLVRIQPNGRFVAAPAAVLGLT